MLAILKRLDSIETLERDPITDTEVLDLMEEISSSISGLETLVTRYGKSQNPIMIRSLSFLLSVESSSSNSEISPLLFSLIEHIQCQNDESTLINCLTAIQRQLINEIGWDYTQNPPECLYPFLIHCLEQSVSVQSGVVSVIAKMYENNLLETFTTEQIALIRSKLIGLLALNNIILNMELQDLQEFLM